MIEISHLSKHFGSVTVVDDLSFSVAPGEVLGFLGPNGAGKSTTMKMITGFLAPDAGGVVVCGHDVGKDPIGVKRLIGYLPEGAPCYGDMSVQQFLDFIAQVRGYKGAERSARIVDVVTRLQLNSVLHQSIDTLSKGFKRRVGLAQAIMHDPKVLVLDEPTDGLDPNQKHQVRELIRNLSRDKIVIISTHILEEVSAVCSRAIIINRGKIVADGSPEDLQAQSQYFHAITLRVSDDYPVVDLLTQVDNVDRVAVEESQPRTFTIFPKQGADIFSSVNSVIQQQQWSVEAFHIDNGRLDDVFHQLTQQASEQAIGGQGVGEQVVGGQL